MKSKTQQLPRKSWIQQRSNRLLADSIIAFLVLIAPFVFYSYLCFPTDKVWETYFFTYTSKFYESVETFMWVFLQKFIFLYLMIIWFFTSQNWWNKAILFPIVMLLYQMIILLNDDIKFKDGELDKIFIIPVAVIICIALVFIKKRISKYTEALDLKEEIEHTINTIKSQIKDAKRD